MKILLHVVPVVGLLGTATTNAVSPLAGPVMRGFMLKTSGEVPFRPTPVRLTGVAAPARPGSAGLPVSTTVEAVWRAPRVGRSALLLQAGQPATRPA